VTGDDRRDRLLRRDARARRAAREVFDRPLVLVAGAGTGKTTALVTRVLAWCLGPGWEAAEAWLREHGEAAPGPDAVARRVMPRVVAITFTEAAAAEMGVRVAAALLAVEAGEPLGWLPEEALPRAPEVRRSRASGLRGAVDLLVVQTIHAYCRRLLVSHPLEAGLHPRLEIDAEGLQQAEVVREVLEARLRGAYAEGEDPDIWLLAERGHGPRELESELLALLAEGLTSADLEVDPWTSSRVAALHQRLLGALRRLADACEGRLHTVRRGAATAAAAQAIDASVAALEDGAWVRPESLEAAAERLEAAWTPSARRKLRAWCEGAFTASEAEVLAGREPTVAEAAAPVEGLVGHALALDPTLHAAARRVLVRLLAQVERRLRARGVATFSALLTGAQQLLVRRPEVAARVRARIDQLLVDEFQDTDQRQCDILRALALSGPPEDRPGLFLVGDPKQSIYGWRNADLAAYAAFVRDVEEAGGRVETLCVNYRSAPCILDEVERVVAPVMREREGVQPAFQPLVPGPETADSPGFARGRFAPTEIWVSATWDDEAAGLAPTRSPDATRLEARALARDLTRLRRTQGVEWKQVGVLFRGRGDLEVYLGALREAGVPFAVEGDRSYYQRREVAEAAALVRCVLDPNDAMALLGWLRSATVGVPDAALVPLWARGLPHRLAQLEGPDAEALADLGEMFGEVARGLPEAEVPGLERVQGWELSLGAAVAALAQLRQGFRTLPADVFVEQLRRLTLFEATQASRHLGAWRAANLERFFRELAEQLDAGTSPHALLRRLRRSVADREQREEGRPQDVTEDAVRLMTIHGAKGLDFDHVYVMQLHKGVGSRGVGGVASREVDGQLEYRLLGVPTPAWDRVGAERAEVERAEQVRALYVATTRARQRLVLAGLWPEQQQRGGGGSLMELLEQRAGGPPDLAALSAPLAQAADAFVDARDTRWLFPALEELRAGPVEAWRSDAVPLPGPEQVRAQRDALHAARARAEARERRRLGGAASAAAHEPGLEDVAEDRFGELPRAHAPGAERARWLGTAIHRALEGFDFTREPDVELAQQRRKLEGLLAGAAREWVEEAVGLLERVASGALMARLRSLADCIVCRELPLLAPPHGETGPVGYVAGVVDLVYREPDTGRLVVVDYKTDRVATPAELEERSLVHRRQGEVYQRALRDALGLDYLPRFELWYLRADEIHE
jgi:ATP-dependent helicase/nuclease subunit A